jgi:pimeloyl-ACP methyl ester carboxylesterase
VVPALVAAGFRVLVPTQRGYAASARPRRRRDYRPSELIGDVLGLLDAAGVDRVHLVGHDWGGAVAWGFAGRHPERMRSMTVLSTPHPRAWAESMVRSNQALRSWYMAFFQLPRLPELLLADRLGKTLSDSGLPAGHVARYCAGMADRAALTGAVNWYRGMLLSGITRDVAVPTSYLWGARDLALGRVAAERTAGHVTGDYTFEALHAGHWLPETRPDQVAAAIIQRARSASS